MKLDGANTAVDPLADASPEEIAALEQAIAAMFFPQILKNAMKIKEMVKEP